MRRTDLERTMMALAIAAGRVSGDVDILRYSLGEYTKAELERDVMRSVAILERRGR